MTLTFNTKFNISDVVYCAECYYDYFFAEQNPYIVTSIITRTSEGCTTISYYITQGGVTIRRPENWLHSTYEECTKWCKEQNK